MEWQQLRRIRRRVRHGMRVREWPWQKKIAVGAWLPVLILAFVLFTGPNHTSSASDVAEKPVTVTTVTVPPAKKSVAELSEKLGEIKQTQEAVEYWVDAMPQRLTLKQQLAKAKWRADRRRQLLEKHKAAVASSHHR